VRSWDMGNSARGGTVAREFGGGRGNKRGHVRALPWWERNKRGFRQLIRVRGKGEFRKFAEGGMTTRAHKP